MHTWSARLIHGLCISLLVGTASAAPDNRQDELDDLRARIQTLQREVEQATETRSEAADALKKSERRISDVNRGLRKLEMRQRELSNNLKQIKAGRAPDNAIALAEVGTLDRQALKDSLAIVRRFRDWLGTHYRLDAL